MHSSLPLVGTRAAGVTVDGDECHVVIHLDARMGEILPELAPEMRQRISRRSRPNDRSSRVRSGCSLRRRFSCRLLRSLPVPAGRRSARRQAVVILYNRIYWGFPPLVP